MAIEIEMTTRKLNAWQQSTKLTYRALSVASLMKYASPSVIVSMLKTYQTARVMKDAQVAALVRTMNVQTVTDWF